MADIRLRVGETVQATFGMVCKRAEVARLPDAENFRVAGFQLRCTTRETAISAAGGSPDSGPIRSSVREILTDDEPVEVSFVFDDPQRFLVDDVWEMSFWYVGDPPVFPPGAGANPRKHLLGTVQVIA